MLTFLLWPKKLSHFCKSTYVTFEHNPLFPSQRERESKSSRSTAGCLETSSHAIIGRLGALPFSGQVPWPRQGAAS
ncbi:hypothetical protein CY34DRAFT_505723 [Suillus luteus UH-Slu-Lm8-n1]|uniref:Uncharacterized protein n=1 Tax=Suillus luteus UH-Slu-Lm8-n1 TaxID=930992 RepID=A0A0D0AQN4_9AGAM|nr:hypothetical protein CY34DRAFT_505723 [Suillus luteus UH-Slu-Lm8-n1]